MNKSVFLLFTLIALSSCLNANGVSVEELNSYGHETNIVDHNAWDTLLKKYVADNGDVDYKGFKKDTEVLNSYIFYLSTQIPSEQWSKQEKLAYFINLYNANTVKLIIDNYHIKSIKDISSPWTKNRIKIWDNNYSLSDIENDILRKMNEPRIHFAINCASKSCPKLLNIAFTAENVDSLLEQAAKDFINNPEKNRISENRIQLSKIFKWYKEDFTKNGNLIDYINQYSMVKIQQDVDVSYMEYDWSLNKQH